MTDKPTIRIVIRPDAPYGWRFDVFDVDDHAVSMYGGTEPEYRAAREAALIYADRLLPREKPIAEWPRISVEYVDE